MRNEPNPMVLPDPWIPSREAIENKSVAGATTIANGTIIGTNNDAFYCPVTFPCDATIYAIRFAGGNTSGNYDIALYDAALNRLVSKGSTALTAAIQELTIADMHVRGGELYWVGFSFSNNVAQCLRISWSAGAYHRALQYGLQASAHPLPDPGVPGSVGTGQVAPLFAFGVR